MNYPEKSISFYWLRMFLIVIARHKFFLASRIQPFTHLSHSWRQLFCALIIFCCLFVDYLGIGDGMWLGSWPLLFTKCFFLTFLQIFQEHIFSFHEKVVSFLFSMCRWSMMFKFIDVLELFFPAFRSWVGFGRIKPSFPLIRPTFNFFIDQLSLFDRLKILFVILITNRRRLNMPLFGLIGLWTKSNTHRLLYLLLSMHWSVYFLMIVSTKLLDVVENLRWLLNNSWETVFLLFFWHWQGNNIPL